MSTSQVKPSSVNSEFIFVPQYCNQVISLQSQSPLFLFRVLLFQQGLENLPRSCFSSTHLCGRRQLPKPFSSEYVNPFLDSIAYEKILKVKTRCAEGRQFPQISHHVTSEPSRPIHDRRACFPKPASGIFLQPQLSYRFSRQLSALDIGIAMQLN